MKPAHAFASALLLVACGEWGSERSAGPNGAPSPTPSVPALEAPTPRAATPVEGDTDLGRTLVAQFECARCHEGIVGAPEVDDDRHCVRCHQRVRDGSLNEPVPAETLGAWRENLHSLNAAPSLTGVGRRLRRDFVASYLTAPFDLRPHLPATMPRLAISSAQAAAIATYLVPDAPPSVALRTSDVPRGRALLDTLACGRCHLMTGTPALHDTPSDEQNETIALAPDLRFVRDRFTAAALVAWLDDPVALKPDTTMPDLVTSRPDAEAIAAYLMLTELAPMLRATVPRRLPVLNRPVAFSEVRERVFRRVCWHCHSDPSYGMGDGGPGNTGGFGFPPRGVNLAEYPAIMNGYLDDNGERRSFFRASEDGVPRLVASMMARYAEVAGQPIVGIRGMPLGLPPLPLEDIQLVETWIAQGRAE